MMTCVLLEWRARIVVSDLDHSTLPSPPRIHVPRRRTVTQTYQKTEKDASWRRRRRRRRPACTLTQCANRGDARCPHRPSIYFPVYICSTTEYGFRIRRVTKSSGQTRGRGWYTSSIHRRATPTSKKPLRLKVWIVMKTVAHLLPRGGLWWTLGG